MGRVKIRIHLDRSAKKVIVRFLTLVKRHNSVWLQREETEVSPSIFPQPFCLSLSLSLHVECYSCGSEQSRAPNEWSAGSLY